MTFSIIVAMDDNAGIGFESMLPWHISDDLKSFKRITSGHIVVMGANTYKSLPDMKPLSDRLNIIMSTTMESEPEGFKLVRSLDELIDYLKYSNDEVFIIGGASMYNMFLPIADRIYMTRIHKDYEVDTYFPYYDGKNWSVIFKADKYLPENNLRVTYTIMQSIRHQTAYCSANSAKYLYDINL